jgi:hypothetical protein
MSGKTRGPDDRRGWRAERCLPRSVGCGGNSQRSCILMQAGTRSCSCSLVPLETRFAASGSSEASTTDLRRTIHSRRGGARWAPGRRTETGGGPNPHVGRRRSEALPASGRPGGGQRLGACLAHLHCSERRYCHPGGHIRAKSTPRKLAGTRLELLRARPLQGGSPNREEKEGPEQSRK